MIQIKNLLFQYPRSSFRLAIEDLRITSGSKVAIVGPSGSGKTTLLNLISGISVPEAGQVQVDSLTVSTMSDRARRDFRISKIGMVFQQFELVEYLRVADNILLPFFVNRSLSQPLPQKHQIIDLAEQMGLRGLLNRYPSELSQGERQRVAISRAMITCPVLILADEPTGNLDPSNKLKILNLLADSCRQNGQTLVAVTHDESILGHFDQVIDVKSYWRA